MLKVVLLVLLLKHCSCFVISNVTDTRWAQCRPMNSGPVPDFYDWSDPYKITPVKNQGRCQACWAFTVIANIESQISIRLKKTLILSEQFLIDCDRARTGCQAGSILKTFANIVSDFGGVLLEQQYPYVGFQRQCQVPLPPKNPVPVIGFQRIPGDENIMAEYVFRCGPLSVAINSAAMERYKGNVIDEPTHETCDPTRLNHAVLIVGYNAYQYENGSRVPYWVIKNSWGTDWGNNGYYFLVRGRNACGIASDVSMAFIDHNI
ncbi:cysteine proteinase 1-like [Anticarsia gemmatalis]|uniref:cysteine proteinase 1-like n=1 Tax=Anticarsia gemmatalis TaxID=129554 RepID=UPI003F759286